MPGSDEKQGAARGPRAWVSGLWARMARVRVVLPPGLAAARARLARYLLNESRHLFALTLLVGVVCGLVAVAFHLAIQAAEALLIDRALRAPGWSWVAWTILSPTAGGLLAGAALTWVVPGARGSGIPQVKQAYALEGGRIRFRDAFGKFIIGALQIGSGASLGREGPTVQICAGATSLLARATALPPRNMRRLIPVGVAAGIAAAFNAPIAAVTFTIEEIVGSLDSTVLSGVVVAAALAAVIERGILGVHPVIEVAQAYGLDHPGSLFFYALLGGAAAVVSVAFTDGLLALRRWFRLVSAIPAWAKPGVGGLVTGLLAVGMLLLFSTKGVTGGGYETLGHALAGRLELRVLVLLCVAKVIATVFSYSSGGAGGIFAPSLFIGAMLGGAVGYLDVAVLHHESSQLGAFALVGMGAVFAGVIRAPITSVLIIFEMTGGYGLVLPLMLANMIAYIVARRWRPVPIYDAFLAQDGVVLPHAAHPAISLDPVSDAVQAHAAQVATEGPLAAGAARPALLPSLRVSSLLSSLVVVPRTMTLAELAARFESSETKALVVRDEHGLHVVLREHLRAVAQDEELQRILIAADLAQPVVTIDASTDLPGLVRSMAHSGVEAAIMVDGEPPEPVGVITRTDLALALLDWYAGLSGASPSEPALPSSLGAARP